VKHITLHAFQQLRRTNATALCTIWTCINIRRRPAQSRQLPHRARLTSGSCILYVQVLIVFVALQEPPWSWNVGRHKELRCIGRSHARIDLVTSLKSLDVVLLWCNIKSCRSVQLGHHLLFRQWLKVGRVNVKPLTDKDWSNMSRDDLVVEFRRNREFCAMLG